MRVAQTRHSNPSQCIENPAAIGRGQLAHALADAKTQPAAASGIHQVQGHRCDPKTQLE